MKAEEVPGLGDRESGVAKAQTGAVVTGPGRRPASLWQLMGNECLASLPCLLPRSRQEARQLGPGKPEGRQPQARSTCGRGQYTGHAWGPV